LLGFLSYGENIEYFVLPICIHKKEDSRLLSSVVASGTITPIIIRKIGKAKQDTRECALVAGHTRAAAREAAPSALMDVGNSKTEPVNLVLLTSQSGQDIAEITICGLLANMDEFFPISTGRKPAFSISTW